MIPSPALVSAAFVSTALAGNPALAPGTAQATNPAPWWEVLGALGPLAVLLGAIVAAVVGGFTLSQRTRADALTLAQNRESDSSALEQKRRADDRSEWWRRAQWALDRALDGRPPTRALGLLTLEVLAHSKLADAEELELFDVAWASLDRLESGTRAHHGSLAYDMEGHAGASQESQEALGPQDRQVQVAAARLRVTLDGRLGRETPEQVKALAKEQF